MNLAVIARVLGALLTLFSLTILLPVAISVWFNDHNYMTFLWGFGAAFIAGISLWAPAYKSRGELKTRDGFLVITAFWTLLSVFAALPLYYSNGLDLSLTDALFEAISGLTTTGATVITGLDKLPPSLLFYRQQLQWLGGLGIVVIAVAILPLLGIGGMQLYRAEAPGPIKDSKLTPRITETAKVLFTLYFMFTLLCALAYHLAGMSWFDAIGHAFSTLSSGGFSTHDAGIEYYQSPAILMICSAFMVIAGINFALHFFVWRENSLRHYLNDTELKVYLSSIVFGVVITGAYLAGSHAYSLPQSFYLGVFNFISIITTSGFASDFTQFPSFLAHTLFLFAFIGGCAGSTAGGIKVVRTLILYRQCARETHRLIHPNAVLSIKAGRGTVTDRVVESIWSFLALYVLAFIVLFLALVSTGVDIHNAFTGLAACLTNFGHAIGEMGNHYKSLNSAAKWILALAMLLGRLEIFTLLVLLNPAFWRR